MISTSENFKPTRNGTALPQTNKHKNGRTKTGHARLNTKSSMAVAHFHEREQTVVYIYFFYILATSSEFDSLRLDRDVIWYQQCELWYCAQPVGSTGMKFRRLCVTKVTDIHTRTHAGTDTHTHAHTLTHCVI